MALPLNLTESNDIESVVVVLLTSSLANVQLYKTLFV